MGKTYIDTVKYLIKARFEVDGLVEKPDIVGAIFGQTEGLLGDELDLRELQKNGRIGRIEVDAQMRSGKSFGTVLIPSSLDMVETSILAASLEVVDRVGPCEARIGVERIEDSRNLKRKQVLDRAKNLLKTLLVEEIPESKELSELVREDVKVADICTHGEDKLPCGPGIANSDMIILVEGRADVINLLRNNIKNVIAVGGANVGRTIANLCREKEVTVFFDGDRGGDIILKELMNATDIDYVARAPPGKEVEELTRKELIKCLRRRVPIEQIEVELADERRNHRRPFERRNGFRNGGFRQQEALPIGYRQEYAVEDTLKEQETKEAVVIEKESLPEPVAEVFEEDPQKVESLKAMLKELEGSLKARLVDANFNSLAEIPIRDLMKTINETEGVEGIVLDGIVTQRLVELAEEKGANYVVGIRAVNITHRPQGMRIIIAE
ncbi:DNA primase [Candidatus Micrarchaeota archaeon]|nr:DNA primase [Candidatus Micrarchaeota archaeon]